MYSETRLIIQEIDHTSAGAQFNESDAVIYRTESVTLDTEARVSSAQLTAKIPVTGDTIPRPGSMVIFEATNDEGEFVRVFVGFVFGYSVDRFGVVEVTAYDAMRYLQNPVSGKWTFGNGVDVSEIIQDIVRQCGLKNMSTEMLIENVGVKPIRFIKIAEKGIDVADELLEWAQLKATAKENNVVSGNQSNKAATRAGERWMFFDNCGTFVLCTANQMAAKVLGLNTPPVIGTERGVTELSMSVSIDESANQVWLLRNSGGMMSGWKAEDASMISQWGPITYFEKIDGAYCRNEEQMKLRAAIELCTRDAEKRSVSITALGMTGLRAGMLVMINAPWLENYFGDVSKSKMVFLDKVSHSWSEGAHTMSLEAEALPGDVDLDAWNKMSMSVVRERKKESKQSEKNKAKK